jgi:hypothetical protein
MAMNNPPLPVLRAKHTPECASKLCLPPGCTFAVHAFPVLKFRISTGTGKQKAATICRLVRLALDHQDRIIAGYEQKSFEEALETARCFLLKMRVYLGTRLPPASAA